MTEWEKYVMHENILSALFLVGMSILGLGFSIVSTYVVFGTILIILGIALLFIFSFWFVNI